MQEFNYNINNKDIAIEFLTTYKEALTHKRVRASAFDTETTGLHPIVDKPFLFQCGYLDVDGIIRTAAIELSTHPDKEEPTVLSKWFINTWNRLTKDSPIYLGHHVSFDQHMMYNVGMMYDKWDNLSDTQFFIRASSDAKQESKGGEPLGLKPYAKKHINGAARDYETKLEHEKTAQAKAYNDSLLKATSWKKKDFNEFFKDKTNDYTDLPPVVQMRYKRWHESLPEYLQLKVTGTVESNMIRYDYLDRANVIEYGHKDVTYTLMIWDMCEPVVTVRNNWTQVKREQEVLKHFWAMERVGFKVNPQYLQDSRIKLKAYIRQRRKDLHALAGEKLSTSQSLRFKAILAERYNITVDTTGSEYMQQVCDKLPESDAKEFIQTMLELRTLEKWYSTYICKFDYQLKLVHDRIYTSVHQCQAVTGRISCDFQQFPKAGLTALDGTELFDPRQMVITDDEYPYIIYLDYSAQELRLQALWTYLIGCPDKNMMRAYCPYLCHRADGTKWNPEDDNLVAQAYDGSWLQDEDNQPWKATDLHGAMTLTIFPDLTEDDPNFHDLRYVGKRTNFAKNYGASYSVIRRMFPEFDDETCHRIDEAYYNTFPGVKAYHDYCFNRENYPYTENLYGVKYYGQGGHNLRNTLVQGSAAYMTKDRICQVAKYMRDNNMKSKICMQIHDELQFYAHKDDDPQHWFNIQAIMADTGSQVPIIADMEVTTTTWKAKKEIKTLEELKHELNI